MMMPALRREQLTNVSCPHRICSNVDHLFIFCLYSPQMLCTTKRVDIAYAGICEMPSQHLDYIAIAVIRADNRYHRCWHSPIINIHILNSLLQCTHKTSLASLLAIFFFLILPLSVSLLISTSHLTLPILMMAPSVAAFQHILTAIHTVAVYNLA